MKTVAVTIEENGDMVFLATDSADIFLECGKTLTRRASHVEPVNLFLRVAFYILRWFGDKNQIAEWTRNWNCEWRVNTKPVGGPILKLSHVYPYVALDSIATWRDRKAAIEAEIKFLNEWFTERGV